MKGGTVLFERLENENEEQFLWRIGQAKDNGRIDLNWEEIAAVMNKEFRDDVSEYLSEAAYRKPYQQAKRFFEAGTFKDITKDTYIAELRDAKQEVKIEKQRLFDERTALNRILRENARTREDLEKLEKLIKENGRFSFQPSNNSDVINSENDMIAMLSDFHLGQDAKNNFGEYNSDVAARRLQQYANQILEIKNLHNSENLYLAILGDILNGEIHFTTQLENRENVTEQIQKSAELISAFVYEMSKHFKMVYVNGIAGNHSRTSFKDQVLRGNRLDNLIPWYMKAKLSHLDNVRFIDDENYDATIGKCDIRGNRYLLVHGDYDSFSENGVSKLVMLLGFKPHAILFGHLHRCSYDNIAGVKIIRSGSFSGTVDDYTISKRLCGAPSQMVCIANSEGVSALYPIELK